MHIYARMHTRAGILEKPPLEQLGSESTLKKRLFLVGKSGVGKSSTVAKLCGRGRVLSIAKVNVYTSTLIFLIFRYFVISR